MNATHVSVRYKLQIRINSGLVFAVLIINTRLPIKVYNTITVTSPISDHRKYLTTNSVRIRYDANYVNNNPDIIKLNPPIKLVLLALTIVNLSIDYR